MLVSLRVENKINQYHHPGSVTIIIRGHGHQRDGCNTPPLLFDVAQQQASDCRKRSVIASTLIPVLRVRESQLNTSRIIDSTQQKYI